MIDIKRKRLSLDTITIRRNLPKFIAYIILIPLFIISSITAPGFFSTYNLVNLLQHVVLIGMVALAGTFIVTSGGLDVSLGALVSLCSICSAKFLLNETLSVPLVFTIVIFIGMGAGLFNAFLIYKLRLTIAVTFASQLLFLGIALLISRGDTIEITRIEWIVLGQGKLGFLPLPVVILGLLFVFLFVIERCSVLGKKICAVGGNERGALLSGINIWQIRSFCFMLGGVGAALAGIVIGAQLHFGSSLLGKDVTFEPIVAIFLGGASMTGGTGSVIGTLGGVLLIGMVSNVLSILNVPGVFHPIINGFILLSALSVNHFLFRQK